MIPATWMPIASWAWSWSKREEVHGGNRRRFGKAVELDSNCSAAWQILGRELAPRLLPCWSTDPEHRDEAIQCYTLLAQARPSTAAPQRKKPWATCITSAPPAGQGHRALDELLFDSHPDSLPVLTMTAWLLATDPNPAVRNGAKALELAQRAEKMSQGKDVRESAFGTFWRQRRKAVIVLRPRKSSSRRTGCPTSLFRMPACWIFQR